MTGATPLLAVSGLNVTFGTAAVVRNLEFSIAAGTTLALVGESGSGKSVTSLAIMRLLPERLGSVSGSVVLDGQDLLKLPETGMRRLRGGRISMIFQEPMTSLNPVQRIGDQIAEAIRVHRGLSGAKLREAVLAMLRKVRIPNPERRIDSYPHTFSGGMRQRVMIAMALACNPALIIADEPTTALDVTVQYQILELLREMQRETGLALLFITHDMGVVAELADHVLVMRHGREVEHGTVHEVFSNPRDPYTRSLIKAAPSLSGTQARRVFEASAFKEAPPASRGGAPALEVSHLSVRFQSRGGILGRVNGEVHAVADVSFALEKGQTLGIVGESGSGKSTIGKAIIDLAPRHSGEVRIAGHQVDYSDPVSIGALRRDVQMIFQDPFGSLDSRQTIGSAIAEPMLVHGLERGKSARRRMEWLLERVGLDPARANSLPHEFSGGQRQRICIARALAMSPKVIVADEAVSALDVTIKEQVIDLMIGLQKEFGVAFLFISHDLSAIETICDRVAVMYFGEIVEIGSCEDVIGRPGHDYTQRLLSAIPITHPDQRGKRARPTIDGGPPPSPMRPPNYLPAPCSWERLAEGHFVRRPA